jgi:hypothetical protein
MMVGLHIPSADKWGEGCLQLAQVSAGPEEYVKVNNSWSLT